MPYECYAFRKYDNAFLVSINQIEPLFRSIGFNGYRSEDHYKMIKNMMLLRRPLDPIEVRSKEKTNTEKFQLYDGYHRYHLSIELGYRFIPIMINDWDMHTFIDSNATHKKSTL